MAGSWRKIRKQSVRLVLIMTVGLKISSSLFSMFALEFFSRHLCVKVRLSYWAGTFRLNFGVSYIIMASAILAHLWGSLHPFL